MKSVFLIAIVAVAIIGVMVPSVFTLNESHAEMIKGGGDIRNNTPYGCLSSDVDHPDTHNQITVKFHTYTRDPDISVVIQMDGKTKLIQYIPPSQLIKISETFSMPEQDSRSFEICLQKSRAGTDERMLDITNVKFTTTKITPPSTPSTPTPSTPTPSTPTIEKSIDCTLKQKPQFDRYYEYGSNWEISIVNPHPNNCKYEVKIYDSAKNYQGVVDKKLISSLGITFTGYSDGEYFILLKSITDGKLYGYYPLTIVDKTTPIDPTIILIVIGVVTVGIIAVAVSKRKKGDSTTEHEPRPDQPPPGALPKIDVHEFVKKCEGGTEEDMFTIMKRKCSDENYRKILQTLLGDLNKINADDGIKMIVFAELATLPDPEKRDPSKGEGFGGMGGGGRKKGDSTTEPEPPNKVNNPRRNPIVEPRFDSEIDRILHATNPLDVLGLSPNVSFSVIKSTYRELSIKYDPNRNIINKSDVQKELDQKISVKLNHAYSQLKRQNLG